MYAPYSGLLAYLIHGTVSITQKASIDVENVSACKEYGGDGDTGQNAGMSMTQWFGGWW